MENYKVSINGIPLYITPASFQDASELRNAFLEAIQKTNVDNLGSNFFNLEFSQEAILPFIKGIISIATSERMENALFKCCEKVLFGDQKVKINRDFFEDVDNREYYYKIMLEVAKANLIPFFKGIGGALKKFTDIIPTGSSIPE